MSRDPNEADTSPAMVTRPSASAIGSGDSQDENEEEDEEEDDDEDDDDDEGEDEGVCARARRGASTQHTAATARSRPNPERRAALQACMATAKL